MKLYPIEDNNSNFELVYLHSINSQLIQPTPHCSIHGAMNKVSSFEGGGYWRCVSSISDTRDNLCRAGCIQQH